MKKVILSLFAVALTSAMAWAQTTNAQLAGNGLSPTGYGYEFDFLDDTAANCFGSNGVRYYAQDPEQKWSITTPGFLTITVPVQTAYDGNAQLAHFYSGNCNTATIDLSSLASPTVRIKLTASGACNIVLITYSGANSNYTGTPNQITFPSGGGSVDTTMALNLTGVTPLNTVSAVGLVVRGPAGWNDFSFAGTVKIDLIQIGDAVTAKGTTATGGTVTGTTTAVNNALISVYPNPARDQINIDLSSLNSSEATVKILNASGTAVYNSTVSNTNVSVSTSALLKGIYMVQVSSGNQIANQKIVIE
ncbi:MAG TPA: T9SS type A sorting domain-containing protein [Cytophagaceae bacterium]|nr:T9SS type A sorting domain-containing protein [Cytophagaceae bacterium]